MTADPATWRVSALVAAGDGWSSAAAVVAGESGRTRRLAALPDGPIEGEIGAAAADAIAAASDALGRDAAMLGQVAHALSEEAVGLTVVLSRLRATADGGERRQLAEEARRLDAELAARLLTLLPAVGPDLAAAAAWPGGSPPPEGAPPAASRRVLDRRDGMTLVGYGDVAGADRIITLVPGTGSSADDVGAQEERVAALLEATNGGGASTAVVLFMHDAPPDLAAAAGDDHYPGAAARLRTATVTVSEINPSAHLHVMGYSHGALVTAQAATGPGLRADSLTFLGGTAMGPGVSSVRDLRLRDRAGRLRDPRDNEARTWAAMAWDDPVRGAPLVTGRGVAPHEDEALARPLPAPGGWPRSPGEAHSSYFRERATLDGIRDALDEALRRDPPGTAPAR